MSKSVERKYPVRTPDQVGKPRAKADRGHPYQELTDRLWNQMDSILSEGKRLGLSDERIAIEVNLNSPAHVVFLMELKSSEGLRELKERRIPDEQLEKFLKWTYQMFFLHATPPRVPQAIVEKETQKSKLDPLNEFGAELESALKAITRVSDDPRAPELFEKFILGNAGQNIHLLQILGKTAKSLQDSMTSTQRYARSFNQSRWSTLTVARDAGYRAKWMPFVVAASVEAEKLFGSHMPSLLADIFNTEYAKKWLGPYPAVTKLAVTRALSRESAKSKIPGLKLKPNPAQRVVDKSKAKKKNFV